MKKLWCILLLCCFAAAGFKARRTVVPYVFPQMQNFPSMPLPGNNPVTAAGVDLGRHLFYDPILSADSTIACASCHRQATAFADGGTAFSKGINGAVQSRNTMPLFNLAWYSSYFWDGRAVSLEEQVYQPVRAHNEMNLSWAEAVKRISRSTMYRKKFATAFGDERIDSARIGMAIAQFERTLLSYRSKYDLVLLGLEEFTADEYNGFMLMNDMSMADCLHCHTTDADVLGTTGDYSNNGLDTITDAATYKDKGLGGANGRREDIGKFRVPSLRNIALTAPYMHDGRFKTLEEVLDFYSEGVNHSVNIDSKMGFVRQQGVRLKPKEKQDIIAFLHTLTDSAFIKDPALGNPFGTGMLVGHK
ncbi:MAG: cytochrome-c peroxidase [Sphingobacteriales bacterium]|nr:MAG: cytochrome-c peroxidase [Sphingobacteriales bacterium]